MMPKTGIGALRARLAATAATAAAAAALGCGGSVPPPNDAWAAAQGDVGRAQTAGALDVPAAKLHLQLAQEDLQVSHQLMGNDNERAASLCAVASSEAQLALSLAAQAKAEARAQGAQTEMQKANGK